MSYKIECEFLVKTMPNIANLEPLFYVRYFLFRGKDLEVRVQKRGERYEFERKALKTDLSAEKQKFEITMEEFEKLKGHADEEIRRTSYKLAENVTLKVYHEKFEGLARVEVEFVSEEDARSFEPPEWFGREITQTSLGRDLRLVGLTEKKYEELFR